MPESAAIRLPLSSQLAQPLRVSRIMTVKEDSVDQELEQRHGLLLLEMAGIGRGQGVYTQSAASSR